MARFEDVSIVGAITLRIEHSLLAVKGATLETIKNVYSHPQGLAQCSNFLKSHEWNQIDTVSTASGAKFVAEKASTENAAVANARNADIYGLEILHQGIENNPNNYTRFVIIAANHLESKNAKIEKPNMATFMFSTKNEAGALYNALGVFKNAGLSLNRLESRPIAGKPWQYWFYGDAQISDKIENPKNYVENVMDELKKVATDVRILGIYKEEK